MVVIIGDHAHVNGGFPLVIFATIVPVFCPKHKTGETLKEEITGLGLLFTCTVFVIVHPPFDKVTV